MDEGRKIIDFKLAKLERRIQKEYSQALTEMRKKSLKYFNRFAEMDEEKREQVENGELDYQEYLRWRQNKMLSGKYYKDMVRSLSEDLSQAREHAQNIIKDILPEMYIESANWGLYEVEKGLHIDTTLTLVDRNALKKLLEDDSSLLPEPSVEIAKELRWNTQKLNSALLQGVLQGESAKDISKRLRKVAEMGKNAAIRNARTMVTGAENRGRVDSYRRAQKMGIKLHQQWLAVHDGRTRLTHRQLDGEVRKIGDRFSNGCRYPADPLGAPAEVYNCRCTLVAALDDYPDDFYSNFKTVDGMPYEEWKRTKPVYKNSKKSKRK